MKTFLLGFVALNSMFGSSIYVNNVTDTGNTIQYSLGYDQIGDQIGLGGTDRLAIQATTQFFNVLSTAGTFDATLSLYTVGVSPTVVGALLGSFTVTNIAIGGFDINNPSTSGTAVVTFSGLNVAVADDLIFVLSVANVLNADLGLTLFDPPNPGSSDNAALITAVGSTFSSSPSAAGFGNVNFTLDATSDVPEPVTLSLVGGSLTILALFRIRRAF